MSFIQWLSFSFFLVLPAIAQEPKLEVHVCSECLARKRAQSLFPQIVDALENAGLEKQVTPRETECTGICRLGVYASLENVTSSGSSQTVKLLSKIKAADIPKVISSCQDALAKLPPSQ